MKQLKINNTSTPYWCVVVPKHSFDFEISMGRIEYWRGIKRLNEYWSTGEIKLPAGNFELLGCITSSGMDEGVREIVDENEWLYDPNVDAENEVRCYRDFEDGNKWWQDAHESALSLLQHNQITLTADTKAVVVKQIT